MDDDNDKVEVVEANFNELLMPDDEVSYSTEEDFRNRIVWKRCRVFDGGNFCKWMVESSLVVMQEKAG